MHAVILAGGLGTRLSTLVRDVPKPMAEVAGRPFLEYLLLQLRRHGVHDAVLSTGHLSHRVEEYFGDGARLGMAIRYSVETEPLGTGGALKLAEPLIGGAACLVMNGDSFFDASIERLTTVHQEAGAVATLALARVTDAERYGSVTLASRTEVAAFVEKGEQRGPAWINGGIYVLEPRIFDLIPAGRPVSLEREVFPALVRRGLHGVPMDGAFIDIGVPDDYLRLRAHPEPLLRLVDGAGTSAE